jgi:hypothetical protein
MDLQSILEENSVVQINENGQEGWIGCFVLVTEVKHWGIQGFVQIPKSEGQAYVRLTYDQIEYIGQAALTIKTI